MEGERQDLSIKYIYYVSTSHVVLTLDNITIPLNALETRQHCAIRNIKSIYNNYALY